MIFSDCSSMDTAINYSWAIVMSRKYFSTRQPTTRDIWNALSDTLEPLSSRSFWCKWFKVAIDSFLLIRFPMFICI